MPEHHVLGGLAFTLPEVFFLKVTHRKPLAPATPHSPSGVEWYRHFEGPAGSALHIHAWRDGLPPESGPMISVESWQATLAKEPVAVHRTSTFMGREDEVLVTHFATARAPQMRFRLFARAMGLDDFLRFLANCELEQG